jgi:xanthine/uracil permease
MKKETNGAGCLWLIGAGFAVIAVLCIFAGFAQAHSPEAAFLTFIGASLISVLCFTLVDIRDRLARIEKRLDTQTKGDDPNTNLEPISGSQ